MWANMRWGQGVTKELVHSEHPEPALARFLFLDDRRPGRGVAIRDRCVGPGEFISAPGVWKSCGFRILHEI